MQALIYANSAADFRAKQAAAEYGGPVAGQRTASAYRATYGRQAGARAAATFTDPRAKLLAAERAADELPAEFVEGARYMLAWCADDLSLSEPPALYFFDTSYAPLTAGFFERAPNEVWANAALCFHDTARELLETVAHEAAHAAQAEQWAAADYQNDARAEVAAAAYARRALANIR